MILFFLTSGLFLGWSLGANDASHVFGSAVGSKMVTFRKAAIVASVFFILGAVLQGSGTSHTLGKLGAVNALGRIIHSRTCCRDYNIYDDQVRPPISTTQAIVGAIIGWNFFTGNHTAAQFSQLLYLPGLPARLWERSSLYCYTLLSSCSRNA